MLAGCLRSAGLFVEHALRHSLTTLPQPDVKFLIFGQGRTGSTLLVDLLNSHHDITCEGENLANGVFNLHHYIRRRSLLRCRTKAYGFKAKIYHITQVQKLNDAKGFLERLDVDGWKIVYLSRQNLLRHALSNLTVEFTQKYHFYSKDDSYSNPKISIDIGILVSEMKKRAKYQAEELRILESIPYLHIVYERDLLNVQLQSDTANRIFSYLGLEASQVDTTLVRINKGTIPDLISNYEEVKMNLCNTPFENFLV